nr:reverse transcriptase domain-containing protein [Tanacetum cinerariifolium]
MANTTPLVTTVMKPTNDPGEANTAPRVNIQELCEEYYEDILPIIMEKARHERLKDVHARLEFGEGPQERIREDSHYSNTRAKNTEPERKKYFKDPVEIHNIKQRDGETLEDFMERFKIQTGRMKGAPECIRISGFMHGINNPELTKRLNEHVPRTMEEMMIATTAFIRGEAAAANKKKRHMSWKPQDQSKKHTDKKPDFRGHSRDGRGANRFTPFTRTPKEILAAEANKFQPPPPMVTPVEKRNGNKFCDFQNDKGHSTDECMQLKKQIEELVRGGKLSHLNKEIKQGREQPKTRRKEAAAKDKPTTIYMVRSWQRTVKQKITQSFEQGKEITFPPLANSHGTEGPLVIEAESLSPYNGIIGRPGLKAIQAVPSTVHGMLKFPTEEGIVTIRSSLLIPAECASVDTSSVTSEEKKARPTNLTVPQHPNFPDQEVVVGGSLSDKGRTELCSLLKKNLDIFAWQPSDMTGVPRSVAEHRLNVREGCPPLRQKKMGQAPERTKAIQAEVEKLVEAWIMREVYYHDWQSNPVMVIKYDGSWRMCVDFTDLNKACPQDCYSLPEIDWNVESLSTDGQGVRKSNGAKHRAEGVFLGYVITPEGIKPCPDKTTTVLQLPSPQTIKEVQSLNGKLAILNSPDDRMGDGTDASLLYKPCVTGPGTKLLTDGKAGVITGLCSKKASKIFSGTSYRVPRSKNKKADALSKIASISFAHLSKQVLVEVLETKSITAKEVTAVIKEEGPTWMTELVNYLKEGTFPEDEKKARKLRLKARQTEAVIPAEIEMPTYRTAVVDVVNNDEELRLNLDLLEERRELAAMSEARSKSKMIKCYNSWVCGVTFKPRDFVYRSNDASHAVAGGKLGPKWEGPYEVTDVLGNGAYKLRTWNVTNLKRCYL